MTSSDRITAWLTLLSAISISTVAAYFSVDGMIAIFSATPWKAGIMTTVLEIGKIVAALWLHQNWGIGKHRFLKVYLMIGLAGLMALTSMGIFGTLSKSFQEKSISAYARTSDVTLTQTQITSLNARKSEIERNIARLDGYVDTYAKSSNERTVMRSVRLAQSQEKTRQSLQKSLDSINLELTELQVKLHNIKNQQYVENADVGPVIYFAEMIYGSNQPDIVDKAVRWVIILIVVCFDPLAIMLLIAAQVSFRESRKDVFVTSVEQAMPVDEALDDSSVDDDIEQCNDIDSMVDEILVSEPTELEVRLARKHSRQREALKRMLTPKR